MIDLFIIKYTEQIPLKKRIFDFMVTLITFRTQILITTMIHIPTISDGDSH